MTHIDSKRIGPFPNNHTGFKRFVEGLIEAGAEGFETPKESFNTLAGIQRGAALRITLYKYEAATSEVVIEEDRASIIKEAILSAGKVGKVDLLCRFCASIMMM